VKKTVCEGSVVGNLQTEMRRLHALGVICGAYEPGVKRKRYDGWWKSMMRTVNLHVYNKISVMDTNRPEMMHCSICYPITSCRKNWGCVLIAVNVTINVEYSNCD